MNKLSVIIPLYNVEDYVLRAARSIACQAFEGLEVVIVDDGSTDNSLSVLENELQGVNVVSVKQKNYGQSIARNNGVKLATGEYLLFLDADDFLLPDAFENILRTIEEKNPDVIFGRYLQWIPEAGFLKNTPCDFSPPLDKLKRTEYIIGALPESSWSIMHYVVKRSLVTENLLKFEPGKVCEDIKWTISLLDIADSISFLPSPFYVYYYTRPNSTMSTFSAKRLIDLNDNICDLVKQYKNRPGLCTLLLHQSFLYINEYVYFDRNGRRSVYEAYKKILPYFSLSNSIVHKIAGNCRHIVLFAILSQLLRTMKKLRRMWRARHVMHTDKTKSIDLKKQQEISYAALVVIDSICKKHNIKYFLLAGTLLGAVRHKGFIPWDDDVDIGMTFVEYEKFNKICKENLPPQYFYSTPSTNKLHPRFFGKVLFNGEQCLDVLPIVKVPNSPLKRKIHCTILKILYVAYQYKLNENLNLQSRGLKCLFVRLCVWPISLLFTRAGLLKITNQRIAMYENAKAVHYMNINGRYALEKDLIKSEWIRDLTTIFFEGGMFPAFKETDAYLTHVFGNYMELPPKKERVPSHIGNVVRIERL